MKPNIENIEKTVMIIGGGVAGMAAAQTLSDYPMNIHLIEKNDRLGGHAASLACMATDTCQNCGSCLGYETADLLSENNHLNIHLGTTIDRIDKKEDQYRVVLNGNDTHLLTDKIILATGYQRHTPDGLMGDCYLNNSQVITTADFNQALNNETLNTVLPQTSSPKIGYIQCVGSRNRETGKDYCSQVCCKISLRQITKLLYLYPDAQISLFYIDLQVIDPETRARFESLSPRIELIQGVPREMFDSKMADKVSVIHEDVDSGQRVVKHFDLMVLSVGMQSPDYNYLISDMLEIPIDQWGFINDHFAMSGKDIYTAGSTAGPVDIITARQQGTHCAEQILQQLMPAKAIDDSVSRPIAVIGNGEKACHISSLIRQYNYPVRLFTDGICEDNDRSRIGDIPIMDLISIRGTSGRFLINYRDLDQAKQDQFAAIIIAESAQAISEVETFDIPDDRRMSLNEIAHLAQTDISCIPEAIVFWMDYSRLESKAAFRTILLLSLMLSRTGRQISIIMRQMQVNGLNGQHLYDQARRQGIRFFRIDSPDDVHVELKEDAIQFKVQDKAVKNYTIGFNADRLVLPEKIQPGRSTDIIAQILNNTPLSNGWLTPANIRHQSINSSRKGIYYIGTRVDETGRIGDIDEADYHLAIDAVLSDIRKISHARSQTSESGFKINTNQCKKCLTCYRVCPHGAITLKDGISPSINLDACYSCGLCLSSCPALAIDSDQFSDRSILGLVKDKPVMVFACERSGALAAKQIDISNSVQIQTVPCACRISRNVLIKALEAGARKVVLAGCHETNCRSIEGTQTVQKRMGRILKIPGVNVADISYCSIAANEPARLKTVLAQLLK